MPLDVSMGGVKWLSLIDHSCLLVLNQKNRHIKQSFFSLVDQLRKKKHYITWDNVGLLTPFTTNNAKILYLENFQALKGLGAYLRKHTHSIFMCISILHMQLFAGKTLLNKLDLL